MDFDSYQELPLPFEKELRKYFGKNERIIIFEIGVCEGEDTIKLRKLYPKSIIYGFEPLPKNVQIIKQHYKEYSLKNVVLTEVALSDKDGTATFHVSSGHPDELPKSKDWDYGNKSSSLLPPKETKNIHKWLKFEENINVKTQRLDSFCVENNISNINFIHMDVQGAELMVLNGAGNMLKNIDAIWMEVEAVELYSKQPLREDVELFMNENNFVCIKDTVDSVSGDQLYIRNGISKKTIISRLKTVI